MHSRVKASRPTLRLCQGTNRSVNPEKTMTGPSGRPRGQGVRTKLSVRSAVAGLDLVRKALGEHEIALVQTTALDEGTRTVRLNTVLAHSSGEWIASTGRSAPSAT